MSDELGVDPQVLAQAAAGITAITGTLAELGIGESASLGRGFSLLTLSPLEAGKQEVQGAFEEFTERWSWGVRYLVRAANAIAEQLDLDAGRFHEMEQTLSNTLKTVWTNAVGDPHLSGDEIGQRSWADTVADNPVNQTLHPDYSSESFRAAADKIQANAESSAQAITGADR
ncbi:hypothetical protein FK531_20515 [Rhodococcus spelaei]|uniref:Uncharacterized protein n=1 Tax=Rhodococcus spelaei TaxID=2546320 RepID=A0A541B0I4_9NOCA|nr:hypothetical protein [Rhodococcus spelaei]TQF65810.1 hypothetical protein FK531_20515 [Rhodococcus spelaei]